MTKSFRYFRIQFGTKSNQDEADKNTKPIYRNAMYMQSRDSGWIDRNTKEFDDPADVLAEDDSLD